MQQQQQDYIRQHFASITNDPDTPTMGLQSANIRLIEFFDYRCPHCTRALENIKQLAHVKQDYAVVYRPVGMMGRKSQNLAKLSIAAWQNKDQLTGSYEKFNEKLFEKNQNSMNDIELWLKSITKPGGAEKIIAAMKTPRVINAYEKNEKFARGVGVRGVPNFFLANVKAKTLVSLPGGAIPASALAKAIDKAREAQA